MRHHVLLPFLLALQRFQLWHAIEKRHDDSVCGDVFVCGQSGVSVTEGGIGIS